MRFIGLLMLLSVALFGCTRSLTTEQDGERIFAVTCAQCHGDDLQGVIGPPLGPGSNAAVEGPEYMEFTVRHGRGRMPSFSSALSDAQIAAVVDYLVEVQGG